MGINQNKAFLNGSYRLSVCSICHSLTVSSVLLYHSITCVWMWDAVVPFVASMPPTANMAPTVALRGRVRGLWSRGRRWGKRWYFIPSIRRRWHSTLSRRRGLLSRSARNYRHMQKRNEKKKQRHQHAESCDSCSWNIWRAHAERRLLSLIERLDEIRPTIINALSHTRPRTHWSSDTLEN